MLLNINKKIHSSKSQPTCLRHTLKGIPAAVVSKIKDNARPIRHQGLLSTGAIKKVINHVSLTRGSTLCSQVTGCSKYEPMGSDRNKSIF